MHPPPEKKEAALRHATSIKTSDDKEKVAHTAGEGQLIPDLVLDLQAANVTHTYRPNAREVVVSCPLCPGGRVFFSVVQPWHVHLDGDLHCRVRSMNREHVIMSLAEKVGKA